MINYIKGYYVLVVEGIDTEKYLNFICKNRVPIYNVKRIDKTKVEFSVSRSDLKKIKNMYRGNKFEVKIKQKTGIPFLARRIYKYKTMVFSAIVSLLLLLSTTQFVTDIYIDCPEGIDKKVLKAELEECGLKPGVFKKTIDRKIIRDHIMQEIDEVAYLSINVKGTNVFVTVTKKDDESTKVANSNYCNIIASKTGIIEKVIARSGEAVVQVGDIVKKGDLLIQGANTTSMPEVWATTFYESVQKKPYIKTINKKTGKKKISKKLIFPRYHQLDVVTKLIEDVKTNGSGKNYLIQHSAGSGKSNSIEWLAYGLANLHKNNEKIFKSVVVVTDRTVLDSQLQDTIYGFDHTDGVVEKIDGKKTSKDLRDAINNGKKIIITTLQKFPYIYDEIDDNTNKNFAIIVDEAHSSQTGSSAMKLKAALADTEAALREYADIEGKAEDEIDRNDKLVQEMLTHGKHQNLSFFAFTATPKPATLEMFGSQWTDGSFHPFHIYSMRQAIEEGFILDVLQNYMTYSTCFKIAKDTPENPELPESRATKIIKKYEKLHPYNISQKSQIIVETFRETTKQKIGGKGKMMVVTDSRLAAVRYFHEIKRYIREQHYADMDILAAFSGTVQDGDEEYTEAGLNVRKDGSHIS